MRWKKKPEAKDGDIKVREGRFLFFPKCLEEEWRWLEYASWSLIRKWDQCTCFYDWYGYQWLD